MKKIPLSILAVTQQTSLGNAYNLILEECGGPRKLAFTIGMAEAQAIAIQLEGMFTARPLVYDFISQITSAFDIIVDEVVISNVDKGIFYSEVVCRRRGCPLDEAFRIDARTSDAVALALKLHCPIYTYDEVLDAAGIVVGEPAAGHDAQARQDLGSLSTAQLNIMLRKAIRREDYELATKIRDEINRRD